VEKYIIWNAETNTESIINDGQEDF